MPRLTSLKPKQRARLQEATDLHNAATGESLTSNRWAWLTLTGNIETVIMDAKNLVEQSEADLEAADLAARTAIAADLEGNA